MTKKAIFRRSLVAVVLAMVIAASALVFSGFSGEDDTPFFIEKQLDEKEFDAVRIHYSCVDGRMGFIKSRLHGYELDISTECSQVWFYPEDDSDEFRFTQYHLVHSVDDYLFEDGYAYIGICNTRYANPNMGLKSDEQPMEDEYAAIRTIIRKDGRIAGYALSIMWDGDGIDEYWHMKTVKSVLFDEVNGEYPDPTLDEVNALIDEAFQRYVVELDMFNLSVQEFEALRNAEWKAEAELMAAAKTRAEEKAREAEAPAEEPMGEGEAPIAKVTPEPEAPTGEEEVPAVKVTPEPEAPAEGPMDEGEYPVVKVTPEP